MSRTSEAEKTSGENSEKVTCRKEIYENRKIKTFK